MNSRDYWRKREDEALKYYQKQEAEYDKEIRRIYQSQLDAIQKEIDSFYGKYASKEGITLAEAKKRVSKADVEAYERKAAKYVKDKDFSSRANEEMRLYNATMRINRLEILKANIGLELISGHDELQKFMGDILKGRTAEELKRQAGILGKTVRNNAQKANAIPNASFHNATFSDRIWMYQDLLKSDLSKLLQSGLIQGKNPRTLARELRKNFDVSASNAERLMRTEMARVQTEAQKQSFISNGFEEYEFIANSGCCDVCQGLNGKHFKVEKMMPGDNAAPLHPHCRCSTAAYEDSEEYEAWLDYLDKGGTTESWEKARKSVENAENSGTIESKYGFKAIRGIHTIDDDIGTTDTPICNPNRKTDPTYKNNCQRCVQTYEFRRRGYDVEAQKRKNVKTSKGDTIVWGYECFVDSAGTPVSYTYGQTAAQVKKEIASAPDGARYVIYVVWKGRGGGAHVFNAEKENGVVRYIDPQVGDTDVSRYFNMGSDKKFGYLRIDDKQITDNLDIINATMRGKQND